MEQWKQKNIDAYENAAQNLTAHYQNTGARVEDVEEIIALCDKSDPFVCEIGCADGRDVGAILEHTSRYHGIDISRAMIALAQANYPNVTFEVADVEGYTFPQGIDIVIAFASLIHVPKESCAQIFARLHDALNDGGLVRISVKHKDTYQSGVKQDTSGERTYFFYDDATMQEMVAPYYDILKTWHKDANGSTWIELILRKK